MRRGLGVGVLMVLLASVASAASAATPAGPRLSTIELIETKGSERDENASSPITALSTFGPKGDRRRRIVQGKDEVKGQVVPFPFYAPSWSADGGLIAFTASAGERAGRIYVVSADGSGLHPVPGTDRGSHPVLSPDGHTLAFSRSRFRFHIDKDPLDGPDKGTSGFYASETTWAIDLNGGKARRITRWRNGLSNTPGSFSADGSVLAVTKSDGNLDGPRIVLMRLDGSGSAELIRLAEEPAISPDGSRVAFVGYLNPDTVEAEEDQDYVIGELYVVGVDGRHVRRLTRNDDIVESAPSWDPSGTRIAYDRRRADTSFLPVFGELFPIGNSIVEINADGSCPTKVLSTSGVALYGAEWQPGLGREAGPIAC